MWAEGWRHPGCAHCAGEEKAGAAVLGQRVATVAFGNILMPLFSHQENEFVTVSAQRVAVRTESVNSKRLAL